MDKITTAHREIMHASVLATVFLSFFGGVFWMAAETFKELHGILIVCSITLVTIACSAGIFLGLMFNRIFKALDDKK
jgi:hypothetical protein